VSTIEREQSMNQTEAVSIIQAIIDSIKSDPSQFSFEISIIGTSATSIGGGTGLSVNAKGGAPGSHTIGFQSSVTDANIKIAQKSADEKIRQEIAWLVDQLQTMIEELKSQSPSHDKLGKIHHSLINTWVPGVIISVIGNILTMALGTKL